MLNKNLWMTLAIATAFAGAACSSSDSAAPAGTGGTAGTAGTGGTGGTGGEADSGADVVDTDVVVDDAADSDAADSDAADPDAGDPDAADGNGGPGPCETCLQASCGTEMNACLGNTECSAGFDEIKTCMGGAGANLDNCAAAAASNHPSAATLISDFIGCLGTNCPNDCG